MRQDQDFLRDILERIDLTMIFVGDGRAAFMASRMTQEAVIRNLEVIGEASKALSDVLHDQHPEVPWRQIAALRNFAIHVYWNIKMERIWQIVEHDLPPLRTQITLILAALDPEA